MKVRLLRRLRKEAYKKYGILEVIMDSGCQKYIAGERKYIADRIKYRGNFVVNDFLVDAKCVLTALRRKYILERVMELRQEKQDKFVSLRNKEWKKL